MTKILRCSLCAVLLLGVVVGLLGGGSVEAQTTGTLDVSCDFPTVRGKAGDRFDFVVKVLWRGSEAKVFNLNVTAPPGWVVSVVRVYTDTQIGAIRIDANRETAEQVGVQFSSVSWYRPEPGEYKVLLDVASDTGDVKKTFELKAIIDSKFDFVMEPVSGKLNMEAVAGENNIFSLDLKNTGATVIQDISFTSSKPESWSVIFVPDRVSSLESGASSRVDVTIRPPRNRTIAGDYAINIGADGKEFSALPLLVRTTIVTPAVWNWTGILIVVLVVLGLAALFWRLSQR